MTGSVHHPVLCKININTVLVKENRGGCWVFEKEIFKEEDKESFENKMTKGIRGAVVVVVG